MTGADFQLKLDAIVTDLQTVGKGQTVQILLRDENNVSQILPLSSNSTGVINAAQFAAVSAFINDLKPVADTYEAARAPVMVLLEAFNLQRATHQIFIDALSTARDDLARELAKDPAYQTAAADLEAARNDPAYISAVATYRDKNVSENYSELTSAKGKYVTAPTT